MCVHAALCIHSHKAARLFSSDFSSRWRPQGNNTQTTPRAAFPFVHCSTSTFSPWQTLFVNMRSHWQWTVRHLSRCLQSSARVYCFRCQGFLSWDGTLRLHDCFKQHRYRKHASRPQGGKAVRTLHISSFVMCVHLKWLPALSILLLLVCDLYKFIHLFIHSFSLPA